MLDSNFIDLIFDHAGYPPEYLQKIGEYERFIDFCEANYCYKNSHGDLIQVTPNCLGNVARMWYADPADMKSKSALVSFVKERFKDKGQTRRESYYINNIHDYTGKAYPVELYEEKSFALGQIYYSKSYFPTEDEFYKLCTNVLDLPDDKKDIHSFLIEHSLLNLNYVPNKVRLTNSYMNDRINIGSMERYFFNNHANIKAEDYVEFENPKSNFSHKNYINCVDNIVAILANDQKAKFGFRKDYQYENAIEALSTYRDYTDYYDEDENDFDQDEKNDISDDRSEQNYILIEPDRLALEVFNQNAEFVAKSAYALSSMFGNQSEAFLQRYLKVYNGELPSQAKPEAKKSKIKSEYSLEEDLDFLCETEFKIGHRINALKLKEYSMLRNQDAEPLALPYSTNPLCTEAVQKNLLDFLDALPQNLTKEKYKSLAKFMQKDLIYKQKDGTPAIRPLEEIKKIMQAWPQLTTQQERMNYKDLLALSQAEGYLNSKAEEFVNMAKLHRLSKGMFDIAQSAYLRGLDTPRTIKGDYQVTAGDYTLRLMKPQDPSIMFVGEGFSCQTVDKAGVYTALSSVEHPFSRAMVVEKNGEAVGLSWLWTSKDESEGPLFKSLCIDNLELSEYVVKDTKTIINGLSELSRKIADDNNIRRVTLGAHATHYNPQYYFGETTDPLKLPESYLTQSKSPNIVGKIDYGDSAHQVLVYKNTSAKPVRQDDPKDFYIAHRDSYTITGDEREAALRVGDAAYPWKAAFPEEERDKTSKFLVLKNYENKVMGYALYSDVNRHVYDVAVHPEHRSYSKYMLFELLNKMKEAGGIWEAETRHDTSYPLIKKMAERGSIGLTEKDLPIGINGEKLYKVYINPNPKANQASREESSQGR